jgi:hypothetical protein
MTSLHYLLLLLYCGKTSSLVKNEKGIQPKRRGVG